MILILILFHMGTSKLVASLATVVGLIVFLHGFSFVRYYLHATAKQRQEGTKQEETNTDSGAVIVHRLDEIKSISIYLQQLHKGVSMKHPGGHLPIIRLSGPVAEVVKATQDSA